MLRNLTGNKFFSLSFDRLSLGVIITWFAVFSICGILMHFIPERIQTLLEGMLGWWVVLAKIGVAVLGWIIGNKNKDKGLKIWCTIAMASISLMYILYFLGFEVVWQHVSAAGFDISELNDCVLLFYILLRYAKR